jgi:hypothetical protein
MATRRAAGNNRSGILGRILLASGSLALLADLAFLAQPIAHLIARIRDGLFGLIPALGLSFLSAARAIAFHQMDYFSLVSRILVLFTAMVAVIVGIALLRSHSAHASQASDLDTSAFRERETQ